MQGKTISGYTLKHHIGTGGMAEVWYAENNIGKKAAVKLLLPKLCQDENVKSRFLTEAKVMVELNHPNIRQVYDYGEIDGRPAIVMEYLDGDDLKAMMKRGKRFSDEDLIFWWNQLVDALNYTHQKGIVHRDIKPGNIFIDKGNNIKLLDFGIAKVRESISSTQTGQKLGTLMYMSPEQVKDSKHIDYHTDSYSLAVTFVHLITGKRPYDSDTSSDFEISEQIVYKPLDLTGLPAHWCAFLQPYLEKDPQQRPELRYFEVLSAAEEPVPDEDDDVATMVAGAAATTPKATVTPKPKPEPKPQPKPQPQRPVAQTQNTQQEEKPKRKAGLWIALGVLAAAAVAVFLLLRKPAADSSAPELDSRQVEETVFNDCQTVDDYRAYLADYGRNAIHYDEARNFIDQHVSDSVAKVEEAAALAQEQAEAEELSQSEADKKAKEEKAAKTAYMDITKIEFQNSDKNNRVITSAGNTLYDSEIKYIDPILKYNGLLDVEKEVEIFVKIYKPNGEMDRGNNSPSGYTYSRKVNVKPGKNNTQMLTGWGTENGGSYVPGTYKYEVWYQGKKIYNTSFTVKEKEKVIEPDYAELTKGTPNALSGGKWRSSLKKSVYNVTTKYSNGEVFKGETDASGKRSGYGIYCHNGDSYYVGTWKNDKRNGYGLYISRDGREMPGCPGCVYFSGAWSSDTRSGSGFCFNKYGNLIYAGNFKNGKPTDPYPSTDTDLGLQFECIEMNNHMGYYVGTTSNGSPFSFGMYIFKDGDLLYGASNNGEMTGNLIMMQFDGEVYTGTWSELTGE